MTDFDYVAFARTVAEMLTVFQRKMPAKDREELTRALFTMLADHAIDDVIAAGRRCVQKHRRFPKPVDWLDELTPAAATCPNDARVMRVEEADELARAASLAYDDAPCPCRECCEHGIDRRPLRFVPDTIGDTDALDRAFNGRRGVLEVVGHWAHGAELVRWYAARDVFFALRKRAPRALLAAVDALVGITREPGQEG